MGEEDEKKYKIINIEVLVADIDTEKCTKCLECIEACKGKCIKEGGEGFPEIDKNECMGCDHCKKACKDDAIFYVLFTQKRKIEKPTKFDIW